MKEYRYSINIFAYRENLDILMKTISFACAEAKKSSFQVKINILINGNLSLFEELTKTLNEQSVLSTLKSDTIDISVFGLKYGDKANTWNQYFYNLRMASKFHIFIDGYVYLNDDTLKIIENNYQKNNFKAATAVPSMGNSAEKIKKQMIREGGIHGNLCIFTNDCIDEYVSNEFKLPLHLYRTDPLLGAVINFDFSPANNDWNPYAVFVIKELTWSTEVKSIINIDDLQSQIKRKIRQAQGNIENQAIKELFAKEKIAISKLPNSASELCLNYLTTKRRTLYRRLTSPFESLCIKKLQITPIDFTLLSEYKVMNF